jgi:CheY-like chemotaxis protein
MAPGNPPILLVDDDDDIRESLAEVLEDKGFEVRTAANGEDGLAVLRAHDDHPSVILLDLMMPVMDGYTFLAEKRADPALADIPVAVITAGNAVDPSRLVGASVIAKPFRVQQVVDVIHRLRAAGAPPA